MPFGQAGFSAGSVGTAIATGIGAFGATALEALIFRLGQGGEGGGGNGIPAPPQLPSGIPGLSGGGGVCPPLFRTGAPAGFSMRPVPWFPVQAPNGKWFFFGHLGTPTFSRLKARRRHHHSRKR